MKTLSFLIILSLVMFGCAAQKNENTKASGEITKLVSKQMTGKIELVQFENKAGRKISGVNDIYFKTAKDKHFVKLCSGNYKRDELLKYEGKTITIQGTVQEGLWDDGCSDELVQSRMGPYLSIKKIEQP